ncbi:MAG: hypothetical protein R3E73_09700 [Porticoccaceae bacterium]
MNKIAQLLENLVGDLQKARLNADSGSIPVVQGLARASARRN